MTPSETWLLRFLRLLPDADAVELAERFFTAGAKVWASGGGEKPHPLMVLLVGLGEMTTQWEAELAE